MTMAFRGETESLSQFKARRPFPNEDAATASFEQGYYRFLLVNGSLALDEEKAILEIFQGPPSSM